MHLTPARISEVERRWGTPRTARLAYEMQAEEWALVQRSVHRGRVHDVTLFIPHEHRLAVIQKPSYPPGVWRVPSGGVALREPFEAGAVREAHEETGLRTMVRRYLLRAEVAFQHEGSTLLWTSHVLEMQYLAGEPQPVDTREVSAARWASLEELAGPVRAAMLSTGLGGFAYRAELHALAVPLLDVVPGSKPGG
ncbi:MAG: NUDIX hydrolase [Chloroflexota bacterium]|nr:NUDIX hydrolase [Chloroflexota bacterium]